MHGRSEQMASFAVFDICDSDVRHHLTTAYYIPQTLQCFSCLTVALPHFVAVYNKHFIVRWIFYSHPIADVHNFEVLKMHA
jgi:hypothetical protein